MAPPTQRKARFLAAVLVAVLTAALTLSGGVLPAAAANGSVSGTVTEAGAGVPLGGVSVTAFCWQVAGSTRGDVCGETQTGANGTYSLSLAPGVHKVLFEHYPAHGAQFHGGGTALADAGSLEVLVPDGGAATGIDAALQPLRVVSGTVSGDSGPVAGINVTAYQASGGGWTSVDDAVTGPDGSYALHLPDGTHRVGFADANGPYRAEFFDDAGTLDLATDVVVAGVAVSGIDAVLGRNHPITGTVTVDGVNMPDVAVTAWQRGTDGSGSPAWNDVKVTNTGADGTYALYLPDGTYRVEFTTWQGRFPTEYYPGASSLDAAADVVVAGTEVPGIDAVIRGQGPESGPAITGTVTVVGTGAASESVLVTAWRRNGPDGEWVVVKGSFTAPDGTYALRVPEGTYRVGFRDFRGRYQPQFYDGAAAVEEATDVVLPTEGVAGIDAQLVENAGIRGVITADEVSEIPSGVPPTMVTAWRWNAGSSDWDRVQDAFSSHDGTYVLHVPDGTYRVGFTAFGPYLPLFYDGVDNLGEATDVTVAGADVVGIDAHLLAESTEPPPTWPAAATLSAAGQDAWSPQVAAGSDGSATAVWFRREGSRSRVQATTRAPDGSWSPPVNLSGPGVDASDPQVALGRKGTALAVWRQWDGAHYRVYAATRAESGTWAAPVALSASGADAWDPQVAVSANGFAVAVWRHAEGATSQVRAATSSSNGRWSAAARLSGAGTDAWDPRLAVGVDGAAVVAWSGSDAAHHRVQVATRPAGEPWSSPVALSGVGEDAWEPDVAVGAKGRAAVAWRGSDGTEDRVQATSRPAGGAWEAPTTISTPGRAAYAPQVAVDPDGTVTAVWSRWDGTHDRAQTASWTPAGAWSPPANLSRAGMDAHAPQVAAGPDGTATAVWRQVDGFAEWVLASVRRPNGSWSTPTWLSQPGPPAYGVAMAAGPDGTVAAVWEQRREGADDRVRGVVRVDSPGPHCQNVFGVDLNVLFGVSERIVDGPCRTVTTGSTWRPITIWTTSPGYDALPPGHVPASASPLEDLMLKLTAVKAVIDAGTSRQRTVVFSPAEALRIDRTFDEYRPDFDAFPMAVSLPRLAPLAAGEHTVRIVWTLSDQHCDGFTEVEEISCLPAGDRSFGTRRFTVVSQ